MKLVHRGPAFEVLRSVAAERINVRSGAVKYLADLNELSEAQTINYLRYLIDLGYIAPPIGRVERAVRLEVTPAGLEWLGPDNAKPYDERAHDLVKPYELPRFGPGYQALHPRRQRVKATSS